MAIPIGFDDSGQFVMAHINFDVPMKKEYLSQLLQVLTAMEKTFKG